MFSKDFVWGAATAAYQIEGATETDGRGESVWDAFCRWDGKVYEGHTGDMACDHYHRFLEDIAIMKKLSIKAYRFSVSWTRIIPDGDGEINEKGLAFYDRLVDALLENGIEPYMTLFHWDYPQALLYKGGWLNPQSPQWFERYARILAKHFSGRVRYFMTFNEPQCFINIGHYQGNHAPGLKLPSGDIVKIYHHALLAHGLAVKTIRENAGAEVKIGYAMSRGFYYPKTPMDIEAARTANFTIKPDMNDLFWSTTWWGDATIFGRYPEDGLALAERYLPEGWQEDLKVIAQPIDFFGQNVYNGYEITGDENGKAVQSKLWEGFPRTAIDWPITPEAMKWACKFLYERYHLPVIITECGISCHDVVSVDGQVHDPNRQDFLNRYLLKLEEAIEEGAVVAGFFQWSLLDNFEWARGYAERFGMIYVDYLTQKRIIKDSGYWYRDVIRSNGALLHQQNQ